ncbi:MAG: methionyl-tRNA formyltransferase [Candidatus Pacebacteria bacterium]|nr:methionyl-tRNA formyltransferase [Candidatus Paceibacterota bacterium]
MTKKEKINIVFFGTPEFAADVLEELKKGGILPDLVVTAPDKPAGRKLKLTPPPVKIWADENNINTLQPQKLDGDFLNQLKKLPSNFCEDFSDWDLFLIAAYGKIIPQTVLNLPKYGTLNVHPSLLPKFRGACPIHSAILAGEKETGVSIMLLDDEMDHGPILAQKKLTLWENSISELPTASELEKQLAILGGKMLADTIPKRVTGKIKAREQNHRQATYCEKLKSDDGLINFNADPKLNFRKIRAFDKWPRAHFFKSPIKNKISNRASGKRIIIKKARLENDQLIIERILPEGEKEINLNN